MTLLNAPVYNDRQERLKKNLLVGSSLTLITLIVLTLAGYMMGHGWLFTNLPAEHKVNTFFSALEARDYPKAFAIYNNDADWAQHPEKYKDYPLSRFTEDWTTESPAKGPIVQHHVDISRTDGTGYFGTGIIVAVRVNGDKKLFMYYLRHDGSLTYPAIHELQY